MRCNFKPVSNSKSASFDFIKSFNSLFLGLFATISNSLYIVLSSFVKGSAIVNGWKVIDFIIAGLWGIGVYLAIHIMTHFLENSGENVKDLIKSGSIAGFIYLEILDASFSFDGVIGAFAITKDIIIIMVGLGVGAMFVRSMTIYLVEKGTLNEYVFLEHGAHYAIEFSLLCF